MSRAKMEGCVTCRECKSALSVTPHSQRIRCSGCQRVIWAKEKEAVAVGRSMKTNSSQEEDKIIINAKRFDFPCTKRKPSNHKSKFKGYSTSIESCPSVSLTEGKRAVLCGVSYKNEKFNLEGTINDVRKMKRLLTNRFDFPDKNILILTEEPECKPPTRKNIQDALSWLVKDCQAGDSLVFYFSGHGLQQADPKNEEIDGYDETICPADFRTEGMIIDNEINETIIRPLRSGVTLYAIIDACHSGTVLDLPFVYNTNEKKWNANYLNEAHRKGTRGGKAICFSACKDNQLAADTNAFSKKVMYGAMTYNFVKAVESNKSITYGDILNSIQDTIKQANGLGWFRANRLKRLFLRRMPQDPLLSASEEFDINTEFKL